LNNRAEPSRSGKPLLERLAGSTAGPPPVWLMRQAGRYLPEYRELRASAGSFLELCYTPELAAEVTLQPVRRFAIDAAILFSDILVVPDALGIEVRFVAGEGPQLEPVRTRSRVERLDPDRVRTHLAPVIETVRRVRADLPAKVALIGFAGAPWTVAAYAIEGCGSRDFLEARRLARSQPELVAELIDVLCEATIAYLIAQIDAGAEVVQLFDSWAGVLPTDELERWCLEPARRIVTQIGAERPGVPVILFPRGAGVSYPCFADLGPAGLALDTTVPIDWAARSLSRPGLCLQGNLDPVALLGPEAAMLESARTILEATAGRPHIFNLGHGVLPDTRPETVSRLVSYLKSVEL
jgi:uroporphyrinogen decarboxylase